MVSQWDTLSSNITSQLKQPSMEAPRSPSDVYLACLTKVDQIPATSAWFLLFDMIPLEAALLGLASESRRWPLLPTILFSVTGAADAVVRSVLGPPKEGPIEGAWYALQLLKDGDPSVDLVGELYPPADEFTQQSGQDWTPRYGLWHIAAFQLLAVPMVDGPDVVLGPPPSNASGYRTRQTANDLLLKAQTKRKFNALKAIVLKGKRTHPIAKRRKLKAPPPPLPPPACAAIGIMDIGQGGCNLLFDQALEPVLYYDVGYPLGFYRTSLPQTMRYDLPAFFTGPIYQNAAGSLEVVLSHWDWDHWRLGAMPAYLLQTLSAVTWTYPAQPMSPTAQNFINYQLGAPNVIAGGTPPQVIVSGAGPNAFSYTMYKYVPPGGAFGGVLINNSGLALKVYVDVAAGASSLMLMTGDGNFQYLPLAAKVGLRAIGAVHHGSIAHGASTNLPAAPLAGTGYIAYSYGVSSVSGNHSYGFPVAGAVTNYQNGGWTAPTEMSTAEGANLNTIFGPPVPGGGNVRLGNQGALAGGYLATSFGPIGYALP